jgi:uncharacterized protein
VNGILHPEDALRKAGCSDSVIEHCRAVCRVAMEFSREFPADRALIATGAMIHDIGRATTHSIAHAQAGAETCRTFGFSEDICRLVECHIGAGLTADECSILNLVPRDCMPSTLEEKIVAHADNLVKGTREISLEARLLRSPHLSRRKKIRMYRLAREIELFR